MTKTKTKKAAVPTIIALQVTRGSYTYVFLGKQCFRRKVRAGRPSYERVEGFVPRDKEIVKTVEVPRDIQLGRLLTGLSPAEGE